MEKWLVLLKDYTSVDLLALWALLPSPLATVVWTLIKITLIVAPLMGFVAYLTLIERKVIAAMQDRVGPDRVGPWGLLQPIADAFKVMFKEVLVPAKADRLIFWMAPLMAIMPALAAWAVLPFQPELVLADIDASLLYILAITSLGVYGVILAGWSSNSKYAFLGAMRSAAQIVSYEIAMGFALVGVLMVSGSLNLGEIVAQQGHGIAGGSLLSWNWIPLFPLFLVYLISALAETNRAPFDVAEGESEIVAGFFVEYSGMAFSVFYMAEYANMCLVSALCALMFMGGWLSPFPADWGFIGHASILWLFAKIFAVLFLFLWFRATFPRYRYDQIMRLGWKVLIPVTLVWITVVGLWMQTPLSLWR